jgi:hypothetical protein
MGGDAPTPVSKQILSIFEAHTRRSQPTAKGVFEVMHADLAKAQRRGFSVSLLPLIGRALPRLSRPCCSSLALAVAGPSSPGYA